MLVDSQMKILITSTPINDTEDLFFGIQAKFQCPFIYHILVSKQNLHTKTI